MYHAIRSVFFGSNSAYKILRLQSSVNIRCANAFAANKKIETIEEKRSHEHVVKNKKEENNDNDDVEFGTGGRLVQMDSKSRRKKDNSFANQFGTLTNKVDDM